MKCIKFFAVAALMIIATSASAQFTNTSTKSSSSSSSVSTDGWSTFWVEWNPLSIKHNEKNADDESATAFSIGYSQAFSVSANLPLFVEAGLGVQYSFNSKDISEELDYDFGDDMDPQLKTNLFSAKIPINLIYAFQIPNSSVSIMPYVGANLRYNISGKNKLEMNLSDDWIDYLEDSYGKKWEKEELVHRDTGLPLAGYDHNVFDKKDMGSSSATWNRFQLGWNIGVKARFGENFLVGLSYGKDFSELAKKTKIATTSITLGYTF